MLLGSCPKFYEAQFKGTEAFNANTKHFSFVSQTNKIKNNIEMIFYVIFINVFLKPF